MKKILSLAMAALMMFSVLPVAYASDVAAELGSQVTVEGTQTSQYEVKVPARLEAGGPAGNVVATGTWKSSETLIVTAPDEVEVTNEETGKTTMVPVVFEGIHAAGDDLAAMSISTPVSIEKGDILFGTWTGIVTYNIDLVNPSINLISFTIDGTVYQAEDGMTWSEWLRSDYNADNYIFNGLMYTYSDAYNARANIQNNGTYFSENPVA